MIMKSTSYLIYLILVIFAISFSTISLINHFNFRTNALDLGMFNQALYQYSVGESAEFTQSLDGVEVNYLCDHFSPITILLSPIRYITGTYSLLILQILALLFSAFYYYKVALLSKISQGNSLLIAGISLSMWPVYSAISYDFHSNVLVASMIPVLYYFLLKRVYWMVVLLSLFCFLCKENAGILLSAFFLVVALDRRNETFTRLKLLAFGVLSLICFAVILLYVMPSFCDGAHANSEGFYRHFGATYSDAMIGMLSHPFEVADLFVSNFDGQIAKTKVTTYIFLVLSGGIFVLLQPRFLILLLAVLSQKVLSTNEVLWDIHGHYSIEFVPVITLSIISFCSRFPTFRFSTHLLTVSLLLALFMSWRGPISRDARSNLFSMKHYQSEINRQEFLMMSGFIPDDAALSCTSQLSPHLSFRNRVYIFPVVKNSEFVLIEKNQMNTYPQTLVDFQTSIESLRVDSNFVVLNETNDLILFRKK